MAPDDTQYLNKYESNSDEPDRIVVIGVGGGGNNAVNYMYSQDIQSVSFVVANTDRQALLSSPVPNKLLLGPTVTRGRGAGAKPEVARAAAEESATDVDNLFGPDVDMVFVTAGMGGGTGTGAAPVVARIARERGLLTIGIVTIPFLFEGLKKINKALAGAEEMSKYVDALLVINNERLTDIYPDEIFEDAFAKADDTLATAARSISEIITNEGYINLDFNDVDTTLRDGEQSPGCSMNLNEKIEVARQLDAMGVDIIEAGFAIASPGDAAAIAAIADTVQNAVVCSLARCKIGRASCRERVCEYV